MSLNTVFQIASQGMTAQRERLEAATANLANANTTRTAEGGPYRRRDVIFEAQPIEDPSQTFDKIFTLAAFRPMFFSPSFEEEQPISPGIHTTTLISESNNGIKKYQPNHPDADENGYVTLPDINPIEETVNILSAARSFEANVTAMNTAKEMARTSLKISEV